MADSKGISGFGTLIKYDAYPEPGTPAPTALAEVSNVKGPNQTVNDIEVTSNDSVEGWKEFIAGLKDGGEVTFELNYFKTTQTTLQTMFGVKKTWTILFPDGSNFKMAGYIKGDSVDAPTDNKISNSITVKVSGKPVFTAAA